MPRPDASRASAAPVAMPSDITRELLTVTRLYPQLWLRVWAVQDGVHLVATLVPPKGFHAEGNKRLVEAVWQPDEVTEQLVVEWGYRALRKLLQDDYEGTGHL